MGILWELEFPFPCTLLVSSSTVTRISKLHNAHVQFLYVRKCTIYLIIRLYLAIQRLAARALIKCLFSFFLRTIVNDIIQTCLLIYLLMYLFYLFICKLFSLMYMCLRVDSIGVGLCRNVRS